ncbi:MAG: VOC family protein, partial [Pseudomonadota bacterium]
TVTAQSADYGTVTPYFTVDDPDALIAFAEAVFDAELIKINHYASGGLQHARLRIGDTVIMLNQSTDAYAAQVSQMHILVGDADAVFDHALDAGAEAIMEPNIRPHGHRMAGVKDPCGNIWWIASRLS